MHLRGVDVLECSLYLLPTAKPAAANCDLHGAVHGLPTRVTPAAPATKTLPVMPNAESKLVSAKERKKVFKSPSDTEVY